MAILEKKALAIWKREFELHVALIMKKENVSKGAALVQAYHEGIEGQAKRLAPPAPPAAPPK